MKKLIVLLLLTQFSCKSNHGSRQSSDTLTNSSFPVKPLIICPDKEDCTGADIRLSITEITENDASIIYRTVSSYHDHNIGFLVSVPKGSVGSKGFGRNIIIQSIGKESDGLLQLLASLYKQKTIGNAKFVKSVSANYVDLAAFAKDVAPEAKNTTPSDESDYKLFFESKTDEAELFLDINPTDKWIDLREKDKEYRPLVIKMLTQSE